MLAMQDIVGFWADEQSVDATGRWCHRLDRQFFPEELHGFHLGYPVSPFVGNILGANTVILNLNGGYDPDLTPQEFPSDESTTIWLTRINNPEQADWSGVSRYYDRANYGEGIRSGRIALINACAYRSPNLKAGTPARRIAESLPSVKFHRRWLKEALLPEASAGRRVILANRWGLWDVSKTANLPIIFDPAPVSSNISAVSWERVNTRLAELDSKKETP